jgi:hypothetical protein
MKRKYRVRLPRGSGSSRRGKKRFAGEALKRWLSRALLCGLLSRTAQAFRPLERLIYQRVLPSAVIIRPTISWHDCSFALE